MVKSLWLLISTLAVANILAIAGLFGWLKATDRLSAERIEAVRELFVQTVSEAEAEEAKVIAAANNKPVEERIKEGEGTAPIPSVMRNDLIHQQDEIARQRIARATRERDDLLRTATARLKELEDRELAFAEQVRQWEAMRERLTAQESTEQFGKTVASYEAQKPDIAMQMMQALIDRGDFEQVVAYLDAMQPRKSSRIVDAFAQEDAALAASLLERLRTLGIVTPDNEQLTDDNSTQTDLAANP